LKNNQVYHAKIKHIDVRFHNIRVILACQHALLENVHTLVNTPDIYGTTIFLYLQR